MIEIPNARQYRENRKNLVHVLSDVDRGAFDTYCKALTADGFSLKEIRTDEFSCYAAFRKGETGVFVNYFDGIRELSFAVEEHCNYFDYSDVCRDRFVSPQITQIALEDFGLSYAVRLSDGRFIVFDGGWNFAPDVEKLYRCLTRDGEAPVIAAWIMTHPHCDHYHCFLGFMERYADKVTVEKFLLNFPEADDPECAASFELKDARVDYDNSERHNIPLLWEWMEKSGAEIHTVHTGQRYRIGDADCRVLSSFDDSVFNKKLVNPMSVVLRMELAGQVILWTADTSFSGVRLNERYGDYLKADILQVPHHGFGGGTPESLTEGYSRIAPSVCLLPLHDYYAYTSFVCHRNYMLHLLRNCNVQEFITGAEERTITLPYTPPSYAKSVYLNKLEEGIASNGSKAWVFTGLSTARPEDFTFEFLNMTYTKAPVSAEIFFQNEKQMIRHVRFTIPRLTTKALDITGEEVDGDALWFNEYSLKKQEIPENAPFAVRFRSDVPIVVSHADHEAAYHL